MGILDDLVQHLFESFAPAFRVWDGRLGICSENTLQGRRIRQVPALDMRLGRADHDFPRVMHIPDEPQVSCLYPLYAHAVGVAYHYHEIEPLIDSGVVAQKLHELLVQPRCAPSCVANLHFNLNVRLAGQASYEGTNEPLVPDIFQEERDPHLSSQVSSFQSL